MTFRKNKTAWLPEYPKHWKVMRIKNLFSEMDERSETGREDLLSVSQYTGITQKKDSLENEDDHITNAESLVGYKVVSKNDLVINIMLAWNGSLGISPFDGIVSPAYCVYRCLPGNNPEYFGYLFSTDLFKGEFRRNSTGIIDSRLRLYSDKFFSIFCFVPPKEEQDGIVRHIKVQEEKIKRFINKKEDFIELLKEQRQTIINKAILHGVNGEVELKDSGLKWLGSVPKHWQTKRLKYCIKGKLKYGANESGSEYEATWYRYIRITDFTKDGQLSDENKLSLPIEVGQEYELNSGDILFARSGATVGKTFQFKNFNDDEKYCFAGYLIKAVPNEEELLSDFLYYFTNSIAFENWKNSIFIKATIENIGADKYSILRIPLPSVDEQERIITFIKSETSLINKAISKAEKEIDNIKEYRNSLIAETVCGKIDLVSKQVSKYIQEDLSVSMAAEL